MAKDPKPTEKSDDDLLTSWGATARNVVCRQKFGWGNKKTCTRPRGHKGQHKQ